MLLATMKQAQHKEQLLLLPFYMMIGYEQAFLDAEFTKVLYFDGNSLLGLMDGRIDGRKGASNDNRISIRPERLMA